MKQKANIQSRISEVRQKYEYDGNYVQQHKLLTKRQKLEFCVKQVKCSG